MWGQTPVWTLFIYCDRRMYFQDPTTGRKVAKNIRPYADDNLFR